MLAAGTAVQATASRAHLADLRVDSAGTHGYHVGDPADERAVMVAARHGIDMTGHRARKVTKADFLDFDLIVALDRGHYDFLETMAPPDTRADLKLFMEYVDASGSDVEDPYYGGVREFEAMIETIGEGVGQILDSL
jgi:protein-tyrosine phosphatase